MSDLIRLSKAQMRRIEAYIPLSHGVSRGDDRRVISPNIFVIRKGLFKARALPAGRGYDADWDRNALAEHGITVCIPSKANRNVPSPHDTVLSSHRHRIKNNSANSKDGRRIDACYDRYAAPFMFAICIAATVISRLNQ